MMVSEILAPPFESRKMTGAAGSSVVRSAAFDVITTIEPTSGGFICATAAWPIHHVL
jgi:hypothetical protein